MNRWEVLERWLFKHHPSSFTAERLADSLNVSTPAASDLIQAYLRAQRAVDSMTTHVLKRTGRTRGAEWSVGERKADAHMICGTTFDDIRIKVRRGFKPDLDRLAAINPQAARYVEAKIIAVTDGALAVLASALDTPYEDED
jgi:hypothetical protein